MLNDERGRDLESLTTELNSLNHKCQQISRKLSDIADDLQEYTNEKDRLAQEYEVSASFWSFWFVFLLIYLLLWYVQNCWLQ